MNEGQKLNIIVREELKKLSLTIQQQATLQGVQGGSFIPDDIQGAWIDVQIMGVKGDVEGLLKLLKQLPSLSRGFGGVKYYINGIRASMGDYYNADVMVGIRTDNMPTLDEDTPSEKLLYEIMQNSDVKRWLEFEERLIKEGVESKYPYYNSNFKPKIKDYSHVNMSELYKQMAKETEHKSNFQNDVVTIREGLNMHNLFGASPLPKPISKVEATQPSEVEEEDDSLLEDDDFDGLNHEFISRPHRG